MVYSCKNCTRRQVGCHATCEDYISQKAEHDRLAAKIRAEKDIENGLMNQTKEAVRKATRRKRTERI